MGPGAGKKHGKRHRSMLSIQSDELNLLEKLRGSRSGEETWKASQVYVVYTKWRVKPLRKATWVQEQGRSMESVTGTVKKHGKRHRSMLSIQSGELNLLEKLRGTRNSEEAWKASQKSYVGPGAGKKHGKRHRSMLSIQSDELNLLEKLRGTRNSEEAWKASQTEREWLRSVASRRVQGKEFSGTTSIVTKSPIASRTLCHDVRAELHM
ncbi:hypothetical protein RRG08_031854 [Elysia crispata]|uniref:Uncharacterized protein n=1 Tax=Elysia crispata TaxID=231223 RepID=A0AAE1AA97_9GAST|nr:hypothetical protein RRG08_031854 [Elysia crispata]